VEGCVLIFRNPDMIPPCILLLLMAKVGISVFLVLDFGTEDK
jgi:hypothetical protein